MFTTDAGERLDVLAGCTAAERAAGNPWYRGAWLYPFPSRLPYGRYTWQGVDYRLPQNAPDGQSAIHGFLNRLTPEILSREITQGTATLRVQYHYDGAEPGYPFPATITLDYALHSPAQLVVTLSVHNRSDVTVPVGVGWHPYFSLGGRIDDVCLQLPAGDMAELDAQLQPTGRAFPFAQFATPARVGDLEVDGSLKLADAAESRAQAMLWSDRLQAGIALWQDMHMTGQTGYRHLQVFIPPDRQSIALEPVSCGINAFNTGENLLGLAPGDTCRFTCGVHLVSRP